MKNTSSTIAAIATPAGSGAIGIIRISGPDTLAIAGKIFTPFSGMPISSMKPSAMNLGTINSADGPVDEVLFTFFKGPRSFTGEDMAEISCHGSSFILSKVMSLLMLHGAREAGPGDFTRRGFLNGKMDLTQAEAVSDVINASSDAALSISLSQLFGKEKEAVLSLRFEILKIFSLIEAGLDFEQDGHGPDSIKTPLLAVETKLKSLIEGADRGITLKEGVTIAITGRPNAGKSMLFNAITGSDRAIVTHLPGTTRDTIDAFRTIDGIRYKLIDTAGIRHSKDIIEAEGIKRAASAVASSDAVIFVVDSSSDLTADDAAIFAGISGKPAVIAFNKSDLPVKISRDDLIKSLSPGSAAMVSVSAASGSGIIDLTNTLKSIIITTKALDSAADIVVASIRHKAALESALIETAEALRELASGSGLEIVSERVRQAASCLGAIIGEVATDDVLDNIFKNFCIGK